MPDESPESNIVSTSRVHDRIVLIVAALWQFAVWGLVFWILYHVVPEQKFILQGSEVEIPGLTRRIIAISDFLVIHTTLVVLIGIALIVGNVFVLKQCERHPAIGIWFVTTTVIPLMLFVYSVTGVRRGYVDMAIELAIRRWVGQ